MNKTEVDTKLRMAGKPLKDMQLLRELDLIVPAVRRGDDAMRFNPPADEVPEAGDHLVAMGRPGDMEKLARRMKGEAA